MTSFERFVVNLSTLLVGLSGAVYALMKYLMTTEDPYAVVNHPLQPWMLDLHVLASPIMIFAVGLIARDHVLYQLRKTANGQARRSGALALGCLLPMISTGYLIQIFTDETARLVCVVVHLTTGGIYLAAFAIHIVISRRIAARGGEAGAQAALTGISTSAMLKGRVAAGANAARTASRGSP